MRKKAMVHFRVFVNGEMHREYDELRTVYGNDRTGQYYIRCLGRKCEAVKKVDGSFEVEHRIRGIPVLGG